MALQGDYDLSDAAEDDRLQARDLGAKGPQSDLFLAQLPQSLTARLLLFDRLTPMPVESDEQLLVLAGGLAARFGDLVRLAVKPVAEPLINFPQLLGEGLRTAPGVEGRRRAIDAQQSRQGSERSQHGMEFMLSVSEAGQLQSGAVEPGDYLAMRPGGLGEQTEGGRGNIMGRLNVPADQFAG